MFRSFIASALTIFSLSTATATPIQGESDAEIKLLIFGSIQCPYAKRFVDLIPALKQEFGDRIAFQYRHFPLSFQKESLPAAIATECAGEQGRFWDYLNQAFANQRILGEITYIEISDHLGLDTVSFANCLNNESIRQRVLNDAFTGQSLGVTGTPTSFINGEVISGAMDYDQLVELIKSKLN